MSFKKYVITNNIIEVYEYSQYCCGRGGANRTKESSKDEKSSSLNYANTNQRRRDMVRRLACCNFDVAYDKFITLTFKDNLQDVIQCNYLFKKFIQRLKYKYKNDLKYLAVIEFQERGAVHYHMLCNLPYIPQKDLQECWGNGFIFVNAICHVDNVGAYIVKYMTKDNKDERLKGLKAYLFSRNLRRPEVYTDKYKKDFQKTEEKIKKKYQLDSLKPVYESCFDTDKLGSCNYTQYNLKRSEKK